MESRLGAEPVCREKVHPWSWDMVLANAPKKSRERMLSWLEGRTWNRARGSWEVTESAKDKNAYLLMVKGELFHSEKIKRVYAAPTPERTLRLAQFTMEQEQRLKLKYFVRKGRTVLGRAAEFQDQCEALHANAGIDSDISSCDASYRAEHQRLLGQHRDDHWALEQPLYVAHGPRWIGNRLVRMKATGIHASGDGDNWSEHVLVQWGLRAEVCQLLRPGAVAAGRVRISLDGDDALDIAPMPRVRTQPSIAFVSPIPGRIQHVRLTKQAQVVDIVSIYQHSWETNLDLHASRRHARATVWAGLRRHTD